MTDIATPYLIPPSLEGRCRLIKVGGHTKVAIESGWQTNANYSPDDPDIISHISSGQNYGIMPTAGVIVIDCDTEEIYDNLPAPWKASLTVITGRDGSVGRHVFLDCPDSPHAKVAINKPVTAEPLGDIRGSDSPFYTIGAGSVHPDSGRTYQYVDLNAPLVKVTWADIVTEVIERYGVKLAREMPVPRQSTISTGGSLTDKLGLRIEDFAMPIKPTRRANGDIQGTHPVHGSSTGMNFAINPSKGTWFCFRCGIGGDPVAWIAYAYCSVPETECNHLDPEQFKAVKDWLRVNGYGPQLKKLDDEHFAAEEAKLTGVDISAILKQVQPEFADTAEIEREIALARARTKLPVFPEMEPGLFKDYMDFGKSVSYSLQEFHFASLLAIASMALGRKVCAKVGMIDIYPNVFVMVVGHTTISGKSAACNMAINALGKAVVHTEPVATCYSTDIIYKTHSESGLVQAIASTYHSLWYYDDCAGFFADLIGYNKNILSTICSLYDGTPVGLTLSKVGKKAGVSHKITCMEPFMSLLFNATTADIESLGNQKLFSSGFFPRIMWFYGQGGQPRKNTEITEDDKLALIQVNNELKYLRDAVGELPNDSIIFKVCDPIEEWKLNATNGRLEKEDEIFRTAVQRGFIHIYKIATILTMCDPDFQDLVLGKEISSYPVKVDIPDHHAKMAIKIVEQYLIPRTVSVYGMCGLIVDDRNNMDKIVRAINNNGGFIDRAKLIKNTHILSKDLDSALNSLVESGEIKRLRQPVDGFPNRYTEMLFKLL